MRFKLLRQRCSRNHPSSAGRCRTPRTFRRKAMYENLMESFRQFLPPNEVAGFNRRMRKTARPVVWEVVSRRRESVVLYER